MDAKLSKVGGVGPAWPVAGEAGESELSSAELDAICGEMPEWMNP